MTEGLNVRARETLRRPVCFGAGLGMCLAGALFFLAAGFFLLDAAFFAGLASAGAACSSAWVSS